MRPRFGKLLDSLVFRSLLLTTLFIVTTFFVIKPDIHGYYAENTNGKVHEAATQSERERLFFGLSPEGWTAVGTFGLFGATIALFIATYALFDTAARESDRADEALEIARIGAEAAKASAEVARETLIATNRAWLRLEIYLGDDHLQFGDDYTSVPVGFRIHNIGNVPARDVSLSAWILGGNVFDKPQGAMLDRQALICELQRAQAGPGFDLFPGDHFPESSGAQAFWKRADISAVDLRKSLLEIKGPAGTLDRLALLFVGACVNYKFLADPSRFHQTSVLYEVCRTTYPDSLLINFGDVPARELTTRSLDMGQGRYAD